MNAVLCILQALASYRHTTRKHCQLAALSAVTLAMPKPKLWSFVVDGDFLLLKSGSGIQHDFGPVIDVRCIEDKPTHIKVLHVAVMHIDILVPAIAIHTVIQCIPYIIGEIPEC